MRNIHIVSKEPCLIINREAFHDDKLVYILVANKKYDYGDGLKSRIVYIGTTKRGADRFAVSAVERGKSILQHHGITQLKVYTVTCKGVRGAKTWRKLEDAFLYNFHEYYSCKPLLNKRRGPKRKEKIDSSFREARIEKIIAHFSNLKS
jgi:hypothetical protein